MGRKAVTCTLGILLFLSLLMPVELAAAEPIEIGVILPLTGKLALDGRYIDMGARFAEQFINDRGGVLGRPIELIYEDDTATPSGAVLAYKRLVEAGVLAVAGPWYSTMAFAVAPVAQELRVPFMTGSVNPQLTQMGHEWVFRTRATDKVTAQVAAEFAVSEFSASRAAVIHDTDEYGRGAAQIIQSYLESRGVSVTVRGYTTGDKDFTGQVLALLRADPDVIIGWGHQTEGGLWLKQARDLGVDAPVIGSSSYALPVFVELAGSYAEGVYAVTEFLAPSPEQRPHMQEFIRLYHETYGEYPEIFACGMFDQINVIVEGIRRAGSTDSEAIRDAILTINDYQATVGTLNYQPNGDCSQETLIGQVQDGQPEFLTRVTVRD